jgi:hypothetical protein
LTGKEDEKISGLYIRNEKQKPFYVWSSSSFYNNNGDEEYEKNRKPCGSNQPIRGNFDNRDRQPGTLFGNAQQEG